MEMMFERARLTLKIHPEFNSLSAANQEFILTRNQFAALALSVIQVPYKQTSHQLLFDQNSFLGFESG
jgi:hypothetical protein